MAVLICSKVLAGRDIGVLLVRDTWCVLLVRDTWFVLLLRDTWCVLAALFQQRLRRQLGDWETA